MRTDNDNSQWNNFFDVHGPGGLGPQQPGEGFSPGASARPSARSPIDGLPGFHGSYEQQATGNRFADAAQALGEGARAAWQHLFGNPQNAGSAYSGMPQFGMPHPWGFSSAYAPRYASTMQPGMMPSMGPMRMVNAIVSGCLGLAIGAFNPMMGLITGVGMFAESEMSARVMQNMMAGFNQQARMQQGGEFSIPYVPPGAMPWSVPVPGAPLGAFANEWMMYMSVLAMMLFMQNAGQGGAPSAAGTTSADGFGQHKGARFSGPANGQPTDMAGHDMPEAESHAASAAVLPPWQLLFDVDGNTTQEQVREKYREFRNQIIDSPENEQLKKRALSELSERYRDALEYFAEYGAAHEPEDRTGI